MGCGASTLATPGNPTIMISDGHSDLLNNNITNNNDRKVNLINGILSKKKTLIKSNSILPINDDLVNSDESVVNQVPTNQVPTTTTKEETKAEEKDGKLLIKKVLIKDKYVQCTSLVPEDELELLMQEDAAHIKSSSAEEDEEKDDQISITESGLCHSMCQTIVSLQKSTSSSAADDVKQKRGTFLRSNATAAEDTTSLFNGQRSTEDDDEEEDVSAHVTLSEESHQHLLLSPNESSSVRTTQDEPKDVKRSSSSSESQTDPMTTVAAATASGNDPSISSVLASLDHVTSPLSHVEKELLNQQQLRDCDCEGLNCSSDCQQSSKSSKKFDERLQKCLNQLLHDMDTDNETHLMINKAVTKKDACVQTYNDYITDESPEYEARPPLTRKKEIIPNQLIFKEIDEKVTKISENGNKFIKISDLVNELIKDIPSNNELLKVRSIFKWITLNIKYNWNCMNKQTSSINQTNQSINSSNQQAEDTFKTKEGICKDYCLLFNEMCNYANLRCKLIQGFAKGFNHKPGYEFKVNNINNDVNLVKNSEDLIHNWNAVYIFNSWRLIDTTWATGFTDQTTGSFVIKLNEFFFLTDPESLIYTHFPFNCNENNYDRWQLLDKPVTLSDFNNLPKVTPSFFDYNLKIRTKLSSAIITFKIQFEIKISSHEPMRFKYKLYSADEVENSSLNHFVFCCLKEDRLLGSFTITPPVEGRYFLKVYAKPEREMLAGQADSSSLHSVVTFALECIKCRRYLEPFPLNELPWGPTQAFFNYKMKLHNQTSPTILSWGGKRKLVIESIEPMLTTLQLFDSEGREMDIRSYVLHEEKNVPNSCGQLFSFTITPPRQGMFKFLIFGMPKPKQKGKWRLPLLASFLVDCKIAKITIKDPNEEDPPPITVISHGSHHSSTTTSIASSSSINNTTTNVTQQQQPSTSSIH